MLYDNVYLDFRRWWRSVGHIGCRNWAPRQLAIMDEQYDAWVVIKQEQEQRQAGFIELIHQTPDLTRFFSALKGNTKIRETLLFDQAQQINAQAFSVDGY